RAENTMAVLKRVCDDEPRRLRDVNPDVPEWLEAIVSRLQRKDPADRFATAQEGADRLSPCLAGPQAGAGPTRKPRGPGPPARRRRRWWVGAVAAALVVAAAGVAWWLHVSNGDRNPDPQPPNGAGEQAWQPRPPLTPEELARLPDPLDDWRREGIPAGALAGLGAGAPPELTGLLG